MAEPIRVRSPFLSVWICAAGLVASCGEAGPCVVCPDVAGIYDVQGTRPSSTCEFDFDVDLSGRLTVIQEESWLRIAEIEIEGTLRDDGSAFFPRTEVASFRDERFMLSLSAVFEEDEGGGMGLRGYATVHYSGDNCSVRSSFTGNRI